MNKENIKVRVSFYAESSTSWALLVDHSDDFTRFSRQEWFPKKICNLEKIEPENRKKDVPKYFLTAPKWLLDKKAVKYSEEKNEPNTAWKIAIELQLKSASESRQIKTNLKKLVKDLLANTDDEFNLVYSSSHLCYKDIIYRKNISQKTLCFILKNYGKFLYRKIKKDKKLF